MKKTFVYFQPEYMNEFKCDGQSCKGHCCKYWTIDVDKKTYKKYVSIKPKTKAKEITQNIKLKSSGDYIIQLNKKKFCPFLTDDYWCMIQRDYGADFLSNTCMTYPRKTFKIGDFYERSLTLTCPVAANIVLNKTEPMAFEQTEISLKDYMNSCRDMVRLLNIPSELMSYIINVQYASISILQERSLKLDQRLIVMGFFFDQLEEMINNNKFKEIETLSIIYSSEDFLKTQVPSLIKSIEFNERDYMRIMFDVFGMLYGEREDVKAEAKKYLDYVVKMLDIKLADDGTASITELLESYNKYSVDRENFLQQNSNIFENYLVNEFFTNLYPWKVAGSIILNYSVFVITYKILELIAVSMSIFKESMSKDDIIDLIRWFIRRIDHGSTYVKPIAEGLKEKYDILKIMRSLLQG